MRSRSQVKKELFGRHSEPRKLTRSTGFITDRLKRTMHACIFMVCASITSSSSSAAERT